MNPALHERMVRALPELPALITPPCPACQGTLATPRFAIEGLASRLVVCAACGLGSLHPLPTPDEVAGFYPSEYYGSPGQKFTSLVEVVVRLVGSRHVNFLTRDLPRGARVLDVGCGRGVLLSALADRGLEVHGVELNEAATRGADPRAQIRIAEHLRDAGYEAGSFSKVIVWHVLEHLRDPRGTLEEAARILAPGGELVVSLPNFSSLQARLAGPGWFHLDPPRHLFHFPAEALRLLFEQTGFEVVSEHHFSLRQNPFGWVQSALNRLPGLPRNGLYTLLHQRDRGEAPPHSALTRLQLRLLYALGMPLGLALSVAAAVGRRGATVCLVGRKP